MSLVKATICIHVIKDDKLFSKEYTSQVPSVGDEVRYGGVGCEKYYKVIHRVWVYDEPESPFERLNIGIEDADEVRSDTDKLRSEAKALREVLHDLNALGFLAHAFDESTDVRDVRVRANSLLSGSPTG